MSEAREKETPDVTNWQKMVDLVQTVVREVRLTEEATWQTVVLITKGGGDFQGIGLV